MRWKELRSWYLLGWYPNIHKKKYESSLIYFTLIFSYLLSLHIYFFDSIFLSLDFSLGLISSSVFKICFFFVSLGSGWKHINTIRIFPSRRISSPPRRISSPPRRISATLHLLLCHRHVSLFSDRCNFLHLQRNSLHLRRRNSSHHSASAVHSTFSITNHPTPARNVFYLFLLLFAISVCYIN